MEKISERIRYLPAAADPLSADVYFVDGDKYCYIYDVGNNAQALDAISRVQKGKKVVLSHYHKDHLGNIDKIEYLDLYVGKLTQEITQKGYLVESKVTIQDGVTIEIIPCVSPHVDGFLILNIGHEYALISDLYFTRPTHSLEKAAKMLDTLRALDTKFFVISHQDAGKVIEKGKLIDELMNYFGVRL